MRGPWSERETLQGGAVFTVLQGCRLPCRNCDAAIMTKIEAEILSIIPACILFAIVVKYSQEENRRNVPSQR